MSCKRSVFGWSAGPGGSEWYRLALPFAALKTLHGWDVQVSTGYPTEWVNNTPDVVVVQRPMTDVALRTMRHWSRSSSCALVVDLDDDMWSIPPDNPAHRLASPVLLERLDNCLGYADLVTVSTTYLAEKVSEHTKTPIRVVPNCVPGALVHRPHRSVRGRKITVGWSGSGTHLGDWKAEAEGIGMA